jgi:hypothetical protein
MDLNTPVEIAFGVTKPLGDCTAEDCRAAAELMQVRAIRNRAAADRLAVGEAPKCDWQYADGTYCDRDSTFIRMGGDVDTDDPRSVCTEHKAAD